MYSQYLESENNSYTYKIAVKFAPGFRPRRSPIFPALQSFFWILYTGMPLEEGSSPLVILKVDYKYLPNAQLLFHILISSPLLG